MKKTVKVLSMLLVLTMLLSMAACGSKEQTETPTTAAAAATEAPQTEAATEPAQQKPVILAVSFGTSYNDSRDVTIGAVENALQDANPDYEVRRAFTSQIMSVTTWKSTT